MDVSDRDRAVRSRRVYVGSQHVWKSTNEGQSWTKISPDLTRHDARTMGASGGPITKDNTGVETYATIFTIAPSARDANLIWTGSDDGFVQVTRDGGANWKNVTPQGAGRLRADQPDRGVAPSCRHRVRGRQSLSAGRFQAVRVPDRRLRRDLDVDHHGRRRPPTSRARFARIRKRAKLLYLGTEHGIYVSFDDGAKWQSLKQNLPDTPVHDIAVEERDLVIATHGRGFYVMDNISPLRQGGLRRPSTFICTSRRTCCGASIAAWPSTTT